MIASRRRSFRAVDPCDQGKACINGPHKLLAIDAKVWWRSRLPVLCYDEMGSPLRRMPVFPDEISTTILLAGNKEIRDVIFGRDLSEQLQRERYDTVADGKFRLVRG